MRVRLDARARRPSSASPTCCSPAWPPTAGCTCPTTWPSLRRRRRARRGAGTYADVGRRGDPARSSATTSTPPTLRRACAPRRTPRSATPAVVPLVQIDHRQWLAELFHGPTLAFKDVALQLVGRLFDHVLGRARRAGHDRRRDERRHRLGGDRGGARLRRRRHRDPLPATVGTSEVQRRQMTTVDAPNVHAVAVEGTFDDCQDLVKAMFNDAPFRERMRLSAVNSINWARVMAQIVYYVTAARALRRADHGRACRPATSATSSPAGSPGGWARRSRDFVVASNANDILTRFVNDGDMSTRRRRADAQPVDGHPGVVELRAAAVRDERPRRARTGEQLRAVPRRRARSTRRRRRPRALDQRARSAPPGSTTPRCSPRSRRVHAETGMLIDPHTATGTVGGPRRSPATTRWSRWRPPTRRSSPTPSSGPPASARRCPTTSPTCSTDPSAPRRLPNDLAVDRGLRRPHLRLKPLLHRSVEQHPSVG